MNSKAKLKGSPRMQRDKDTRKKNLQVEKYERPMRNSDIPLRREHHSEIIAENFPELKKDRRPQSEKAYCVLGRETKVNYI